MAYALTHRKEKQNEASARWRARHPEKAAKADRKHHLRTLYGLSLDTFAERVRAQGGVCGICEGPMDPPYVDHCHKTGAVRGILCGACNRGLGHFHDNPTSLARAIIYLDK